jgi:CheY-like chemotaxis protein
MVNAIAAVKSAPLRTSDLAKATAAGAEGPLQKPFSPEDMLHVVEKVA